MYFKVLKDNKVIDVLDHLVYLKWKPKHKTMVLSYINEAQAILSSNDETIWHETTLYKIPVEAGFYDSVSIESIDEYEYKKLKALNMRTPESIVDEVILYLVNNGII